jgi:hypothetical protein
LKLDVKITHGGSSKLGQAHLKCPKGQGRDGKKVRIAQEHERMAEEEYERAAKLAEQWATHTKQTQEEAKQNKTRRRDAIPHRNINFDSAAHRKPLATPKDNIEKAAELLANDNDKIDLDYLKKIIGTAMKQQSKGDTSRRLASNAEACVSTTQNQPAGRQQGHHNDQSRTDSTEHWRKTKEHPNPIPISSDTPKDKD